MQKIVHDARTKQAVLVDMSAEEIADIARMQAEVAAREALPKPGADLLALAESSRSNADLKLVVVELIRRVYGLPAPAVEELPVEAEARA